MITKLVNRFWYLYYRFYRPWRYPPVVVISRSGQRTPRPQVHVSAQGVRGSQTVYTWDADEQGEACATMYGQGLADILQRKLVDEREKV